MQAACVGLPHRTEDNRLLGLALVKKVHGEHWRRLFRGDPDGARCMLPPYRLAGAAGLAFHFALCDVLGAMSMKGTLRSCCAESDADVLLEVDLPFWICPEDVTVRILPDRMLVSVRNELSLCRTYWQNRQHPMKPLYSSLLQLDLATGCRQGRTSALEHVSCAASTGRRRAGEGPGKRWTLRRACGAWTVVRSQTGRSSRH